MDRSADAPGADVVELASRRPAAGRSASASRWIGLAVAAAALLVLGVGIGRVSAPSVQEPGAGVEVARSAPDGAPFRQAAVEHLQGTETLLTVVRSDASTGELDPQLRALARGMLSQTRLFLDASAGVDPEVRRLLEDMELILAQLVSVTEDGSRSRTELDLALRGLENREVLTRIRTLSGTGMAGT